MEVRWHEKAPTTVVELLEAPAAVLREEILTGALDMHR
jgi:hypothetical protein